MCRKKQAEALRKVLELLEEMADIQVFGVTLLDTIEAWEREPVLRKALRDVLSGNFTSRTREQAESILNNNEH